MSAEHVPTPTENTDQLSKKKRRDLISDAERRLSFLFESTYDYADYFEQQRAEARQHNRFRPGTIPNSLSNYKEAQYFAVKHFIDRLTSTERISAADAFHVRRAVFMAESLACNLRFENIRSKISDDDMKLFQLVASFDYPKLKNGEQ